MLAEITAGYSGLKAAFDIAKGLNVANTQAQINEIKIALQQHIIDGQVALGAARDAEAASASRIADLEQEIVRLKDWTGEAHRYQLVNVRHGAIAYAPKPGMENGKPPHWLCANCFNQTRKSFLQNKGQNGPEATYGCDACKGSFKVPYRYHPEALARTPEGGA